jgi:phosphoribosylglycinamide formyltransferase-1
LLAIIEAIDRGELPATVALVVSNRAEAPGLEHARRRDLPVLVADRQTYPTRAARHGAIHAALDEARVELVICAGWSEILLPSLVNAYAGRMLNIHPSLVPAFGGGMHAQADALAHGVKITGCTVHFVTDEVDGGPIVIQRAVPVLDDDTVETLSARILAEEHRALPKAIRLFAENRLRIEGRRVRVLSTTLEPSPQPSPSGRGGAG